jgi:hypothetical protein
MCHFRVIGFVDCFLHSFLVELSHWIPPIWDETVFDPAHKSAL